MVSPGCDGDGCSEGTRRTRRCRGRRSWRSNRSSGAQHGVDLAGHHNTADQLQNELDLDKVGRMDVPRGVLQDGVDMADHLRQRPRDSDKAAELDPCLHGMHRLTVQQGDIDRFQVDHTAHDNLVIEEHDLLPRHVNPDNLEIQQLLGAGLVFGDADIICHQRLGVSLADYLLQREGLHLVIGSGAVGDGGDKIDIPGFSDDDVERHDQFYSGGVRAMGIKRQVFDQLLNIDTQVPDVYMPELSGQVRQGHELGEVIPVVHVVHRLVALSLRATYMNCRWASASIIA